ncbi:phosphoribosyl 1,2-cyclic phosphate phosphodiesterase [Mycoplana sp. BE70]|uniref:MBL fold metallo-hydrolase n=1 Tax=Mycoplana sp. BE70 TaxID=2817775 RepID=UPI00285A26F2|nr:MBL fold metallo-hydrolase [Mycoplana sp. BE70]MDR6758189.1 phosphoribosyl 1,2-cyclic phosphate phosphodiesterase [Mycoplana sp. BE70]
MSYRRRFTILGCGSSPGTPRITGDWGDCDPANPKNRRTRTALLVEQMGPDGRTTVVIDTGPDFREQMIAAGVKSIDAVLYTHAHADHIHGIDDIRGFVQHSRKQIPIWADPLTMARIREGFGYCLETPPGSFYPPIVTAHLIESVDMPVVIRGAGGAMRFDPLLQDHGSIHSLAFRAGNVAYCTDVSAFPAATASRLTGLDLLIIDALQYRTHASHFSLGQALEWIDRLAPNRAVLTHMHTPLDYDRVMAETPDHVEPAYDQMAVEFDVTDEVISLDATYAV